MLNLARLNQVIFLQPHRVLWDKSQIYYKTFSASSTTFLFAIRRWVSVQLLFHLHDSCDLAAMVPPSPSSAKSNNPEPRPPIPAEPEAGEPRKAWFRFFLNTNEKSSRIPKPITPDSSADLTSTPSTTRKKVGWSEKYDYKDPPKTVTDKHILSAHAISPLTPSAERKATKSILKTNHGLEPLHTIVSFGGSDTVSTSNFPLLDARMLESISKQLAGQDRSSKLDAYTTLSGALKACDNVPDRKALSDKMDLILQFVKRDLNAKHESGALDIQLAKEALVLTSSFLHKKSISDMLTPDFNSYLVDHALKTFENPAMSKEIARHLMFIIAQQKFSARIMTAERVTKLISAIHKIEDFVRGKSIVEQRINIYRTFLRQSKSYMISNSDWLGDLFSDMLSSYSNIQTAAIAFGEEAGLDLGTESKVSSKVMEIFKGSDGKNVKYIDFFADRLRKMAARKPPGPTPRIWAVVILFLRARPQQLEHWAFIKVWLDVIKVCFNSSDQNTRLATNLAWNRMIFVIGLDEKVTSNMMHTLSQPLIAQLQRKDVRKVSNPDNLYRKSTINSIYNLLYYSVKPNITQAQLDTFWDTNIVQIVGKRLTPTDYVENPTSAGQDLSDACSILCGLFNSHTQRPWTPTRALNHNLVTAKELPGLDPRWLRKNALRVFQILSPIMELLYWDFAMSESKISLLWETYISSISSAGAKEVKTSNDTMACLAFLFSTLYKIWQKGPDGLNALPSHRKDEAGFFASFKAIVTIVISGLGVLPFTERLLSMVQKDDFIVVATPSHRPGKIKGQIRSPLHHLFLLLASASPGVENDCKFFEMAQAILTPFFDARRVSQGKMDLVKDLLDILPTDNTASCKGLWTILAKFATVAINFCDDSVVSSSIHDARPLGGEYRSVVKILDAGINLSPKEPLQGWEKLFQALVMSATTGSGHGGRAIVVIEPIAKTLALIWQPNGESCGEKAKYCQLLVAQASYPKDRQALDAARRRLWGSATAGPRIDIFDPYFHLYEYVSRCLEYSYTELSSNDHHSICGLVSEIEALLVRCPKVLLSEALTRLQNGLVCWIRDEEGKLHGGSNISRIVNCLWTKICSLLGSITNDPQELLANLEPLLCSGLGSKRVSIANTALEMWKDTFGSFNGELTYPSMVKVVLSRLLPMADISLPSFSESSENRISDNHRQLPAFIDTQTDCNISGEVNLPDLSNKASSNMIQSHKQKMIGSSPRVVIGASKAESRKRSRETTPEPGKRKTRKRSSVAKLRHDDSQIQFEAIAGSSPLSEAIYDSDILTDRQKEVRERQAEAAAMFPDIRSSPPPSSRPTSEHVDNNNELPSRQSASKLRLETPANSKRQSTPDTRIIENQDIFLASSPTPARHTLASKDISCPPSSPPAVASNKRSAFISKNKSVAITSSPPQTGTRNSASWSAAHKGLNRFEQSPPPPDLPMSKSASAPLTSSDEFNVTSFPSHFLEGFDDDPTMNRSLSSFAQKVLYAFDPGQTMSTYRSTAMSSGGEEDMDVTIELTSSEEQARDRYLQQSSTENGARNTCEAQTAETIKDPVINNDSILPSTPRRSPRCVAAKKPAPNTPRDVVLDARSSVVSADNAPSDDEKFEDAVSSPRALPPRIQKSSEVVSVPNDSSSPLTDLDESSFYRLANSVDRKLAENRDRAGGPIHVSAELGAVSLNAVFPETPHIIPDSKRRSPVRSMSRSSAIQSVIPETPAPQPLKENDGDDISRELAEDNSNAGSAITIAPHVGDQQVRRINTSKSPKPVRRKNSPVKMRIENEGRMEISGKKRKFDEILDVGSAVPDSQEAPEDVQSLPSPKKRKGRPAKTPETIITSASEPQSTRSERSERASRRNTRSSQARTVIENNSSIEDLPEFNSASNVMETSSSIVSNDRPAIPVSGNEAIDDTNFGIPEPEEQASPVPDQLDPDYVEETLLQSQIAEEMQFGSQEATNDQPEEIAKTASTAPTYQNIKEKLLSLVKDLEDAALSRDEGNEMEDMFMDAKVQLYGAIKRGRQLADD
ncbi:4acba6b2-06ee-422d-a714-a7b85db6248c [Sclerotinia trifoliorum]|uniref:4acba6b2-06ee-422d-a714-a7b85db6248c n=1 Tax=Sclerotinia trifoliorum TaxID=28548 RepID=A0A8H2W1P1_9HELO|nr:4acba6b2-06ee-422d-a714-a7b85db6248c [Sclerotinia trifoliorum]